MARVLSALVLLPVVIGTVWYLPPVATLGLATIAALVAFAEYAGIVAALGVQVPRLVIGAAVAAAGYRPGLFWAAVVVATEVIGGPMLALGLFTRPVCVPIVILLALSVVAHWRDGWFWNTLGIEYPLLWAACALYFLVNGGGAISVDRLIGWEF